MANEKAWYILWFCRAEPREPYPLPCLNLITLITVFLLLFACLACPCASLCSHTLAPRTRSVGFVDKSTHQVG